MSSDLILLTGATGFLGYKVLVKALEAGYRVRCAIRSPSGIDKILAAESMKKLSPTADQLSWEIVPDITVPGAYDAAVAGVTYVVHCASPVGTFGDGDRPSWTDDEAYVAPAVRGSVGMLESAARCAGPALRRVVVTSSVVAVFSLQFFEGRGPRDAAPFTADFRQPDWTPPYPVGRAYFASKVASLNACEAWMRENAPSFDMITTLPAWISGRDELSSTKQHLRNSSNSQFINFVTGEKAPSPINAAFVSVDSCALAHVLALKPEVAGNQSFILGRLEDLEQARAIGKRQFPGAFADGTFREDGVQPVVRIPMDDSKAERELGFKLESLEEWLTGLLGQYVAFSKNE